MKEKKQGKKLSLPDLVILALLGILCFYGVFRAAFRGIGETPENVLYRATNLGVEFDTVPVTEIDDTGLLVLADRDHPVDDANPAVLKQTDTDNIFLHDHANTALRGFFAAAEQQGFQLSLNSGFRNTAKQQELFVQEVQKLISEKSWNQDKAEAEAEKSVARPGRSEHHLGLAADIGIEGVSAFDVNTFTATPAFEWIEENAATYGFVMSYPKNKEGVTGVKFEPWHFRYYDAPHAAVMQSNRYVLKQYLSALKPDNWYTVRSGGRNYTIGKVVPVEGSIQVPKYTNLSVSSDGSGNYIITGWN